VYLRNIIYQVSISKIYLNTRSGNKNISKIDAGIKDKIIVENLPLVLIRLLKPVSKNINQITRK